MLPLPNLDDQTYDELLSEARNVVTSYYPEWTNFNEHDPGITLLELFAMLVESQQYYLDQIGEINRIKYLKLMGVGRRSKRPAETLVKIDNREAFSLLLGHKLMAGALCFETQGERFLPEGHIVSLYAVRGETILDKAVLEQMDIMQAIRFLPFGAKPEPGTVCLIRFNGSLPADQKLDLYLEVSNGAGRRNPLKGAGFVPPARLEWQFLSEKGWEPLIHVSDETSGLLFKGFVSFTLPGEAVREKIFGEEGYFLRVVLTEGCYDAAPVILQASMSILRCRQQRTSVECGIYAGEQLRREDGILRISARTELSAFGQTEVYLWDRNGYYPFDEFDKKIDSERGMVDIRVYHASTAKKVLLIHRELSDVPRRVLGEGSGFPNQVIDLEDVRLVRSPFVLLVEDELHKGRYRLWKQVSDFALSRPEDRHFVLRSDLGKLFFGDGKAGRMPEGEILSAHVVRSSGSGGNIRKARIEHFAIPDFMDISVTNITEGEGGRDEEPLEEALLRASGKIIRPKVLVTAEDYERAVRAAPGLLIADCKVLFYDQIVEFFRKADKNAVHIVVEPAGYDPEAGIEENYRINILNAIEPFRMIGQWIEIYFVEYIDVDVYVELITDEIFRDIRNQIERKLHAYFRRELAAFGAQVSHSDLYSYLEYQPDVRGVRSLSIHAGGAHTTRSRQGDLVIPPYAKVRLQKTEIVLDIG